MPILAGGRPFCLAPMSFQEVPIIRGALPYFLAQEEFQAFLVLSLLLESAVSPRSPGSCQSRIVFRSQDLGTRMA